MKNNKELPKGQKMHFPNAFFGLIFLIVGISVLALTVLTLSAETISKSNKYSFEKTERDPFAPLITKSGQILVKKTTGAASLGLKGIIYSKNGSIAIIGDEVFKENDIINDYRIMKISKKKVILKKDKDIIILKLEENGDEK